MHKLVKANVGWRTLAAVIDLLIACFLGMGVFALTQTIFMNSASGQQLTTLIHDYQVNSGLYYDDENGDLSPFDDYSDYTRYQSMISNYYLVYLPNMDESIKYDTYWYNVFVLGLPDEKGIYSKEELGNIQEPSKGCALWEYQTVEGTKSLDLLGVPASNLYQDGKLTERAKTDLLTFYCSTEKRSVYYNAMQNLFHQNFYETAYNKASAYNILYPLCIAIPLTLLIVYLIFPLCFKNGETPAKKMFHLCLVNKLGFRIKKGQLALRALPAILLAVILVLFLPLLWSVSILSLVVFASYLCSIFTPNKQALHDMIAGTMVISEKESLFYDDLASQEAGEKFYKQRMEHAEKEIEEGRKAIEEEERAKWRFKN